MSDHIAAFFETPRRVRAALVAEGLREAPERVSKSTGASRYIPAQYGFRLAWSNWPDFIRIQECKSDRSYLRAYDLKTPKRSLEAMQAALKKHGIECRIGGDHFRKGLYLWVLPAVTN